MAPTKNKTVKYGVKLIDMIIQSMLILMLFVFLFRWGAVGYIFYGVFGVYGYHLISILLHYITKNPIGSGRLGYQVVYAVISVFIIISFLVPSMLFLNHFIFFPIMIVSIILYLVLTLVEMNSTKTVTKEYLDF